LTLQWQHILQQSSDDIIQLASDVGIDGRQLLTCLPNSGELMTGRSVPVIEHKYRNTCSVLFFINNTDRGGTWPYLKLHTFKHGGITREFNGLKASNNRQISKEMPHQHPKTNIIQRKQASIIDDIWRMDNFRNQASKYFNGQTLLHSTWLHTRLCGLATPLLLSRTPLRIDNQGALFAPMTHLQTGLVGYHKIYKQGEKDQKRHFIYATGKLKASVIIIEPTRHIYSQQIAICEGVATALTLALCWPGTLYIALTANNLEAVRATIAESCQVTFFADNDQWKPTVGNVGINAAKSAARANDIISWPQFESKHSQLKPTDYNDLLMLQGLKSLQSQLGIC
jgi:putative DNA primase/helicase